MKRLALLLLFLTSLSYTSFSQLDVEEMFSMNFNQHYKTLTEQGYNLTEIMDWGEEVRINFLYGDRMNWNSTEWVEIGIDYYSNIVPESLNYFTNSESVYKKIRFYLKENATSFSAKTENGRTEETYETPKYKAKIDFNETLRGVLYIIEIEDKL